RCRSAPPPRARAGATRDARRGSGSRRRAPPRCARGGEARAWRRAAPSVSARRRERERAAAWLRSTLATAAALLQADRSAAESLTLVIRICIVFASSVGARQSSDWSDTLGGGPDGCEEGCKERRQEGREAHDEEEVFAQE